MVKIKKEALTILLMIIAILFLTSSAKSQNETCTPNWTCTDWSPCMDNIQIRSCIDLNLCNTSLGKPHENQTCGKICQPQWTCNEWEPKECNETEMQYRTCIDTNSCNTSAGRPEEMKSCTYNPNRAWIVFFIIMIIIILIVGTLGIIRDRFKKKYKKFSSKPL